MSAISPPKQQLQSLCRACGTSVSREHVEIISFPRLQVAIYVEQDRAAANADVSVESMLTLLSVSRLSCFLDAAGTAHAGFFRGVMWEFLCHRRTLARYAFWLWVLSSVSCEQHRCLFGTKGKRRPIMQAPTSTWREPRNPSRYVPWCSTLNGCVQVRPCLDHARLAYGVRRVECLRVQ